MSAFQPREALRAKIDRTRGEGQTVLAQVLSGIGGVGKSQLAAAYFQQAVEDRVDLTVWVAAGDVQLALGQYAQAARAVAAPGATGDPTAVKSDARAFLNWLRATDRPWMVVLDDVTDFEAMAPWWPPARPWVGWTLGTTRQRGATVTGQGRAIVDVDVFDHDEAIAYLHERLTELGLSRLLDGNEDQLVTELGRLPLALGYAAAYLINENISAGEYLVELRDRKLSLRHVLPAGGEGYDGPGGRPRDIAAALLLSLDAVTRTGADGDPVHEGGPLAVGLLRLISVFSPDGQPEGLFHSDAVRDALAGISPEGHFPPPDRRTIRRGLRLLHNYGLITHQDDQPIRIHALTARATRDTTPAAIKGAVARAAADALVKIVPAGSGYNRNTHTPIVINGQSVLSHGESHLWSADGAHPLLHDMASLLRSAGLQQQAHELLERLSSRLQTHLGSDHPDTLSARAELAITLSDLGRHQEALALEKAVLADRERLLGPDHPDTVGSRHNLGAAYADLGRHHEALRIQEAVLADRERLLGPDQPHTVTARHNLAITYSELGRHHEALPAKEAVLVDRERLLGPDHPDTLTARNSLAITYSRLGRHHDALRVQEAVLVDRERLLGPDHPTTFSARRDLAATYTDLGRHDDALLVKEAVLAGRERLLGPEHPDTLSARLNLAVTYTALGRHQEALALEEAVLASRERLLGPDHPDTLTARLNLAVTYAELGRHQEALALEEAVLTSRERLLGPDHPATLHARANLVFTYLDLGRHQEALALQEAVLADRERLLGPDHPATLTTRLDLATTYTELGRHHEALALQEAVLADAERLLAPDHPERLRARLGLATTYNELGRHDEALALAEGVIADGERLLGPDNPEVLHARIALADADSMIETGETPQE
ncbi:FxSxx-COOH system tetratricopeptide repeat protein [Streptomyces xanthophaeus]